MKILSISSDSNIFVSGSEVRRRMIDYGSLVEELHIIVFTSGKHKSQKISGNVWVYSAESFRKLKILYSYPLWDPLRDVRKEVGEIRFNLITSQDPFETGLVAWRIAKELGAKLQVQIHTDFLSPHFKNRSYLQDYFRRIRAIDAKFTISEADDIRVVSSRIKQSLEGNARYRIKDEAEITVLPIFVDTKKIKDAPINVDLKKKYPGKKIILMASRITKEKNIQLAIGVIREVIKKYPNILLLIVGNGPEKKNLEDRIKNLKLQNNVEIEKLVPFETLISYYKTADMFLLTSNYEGYGLTLAEAASTGLPIVSTDVGIAREIEGASVVGVGDEARIGKVIIETLEKPKKTVFKGVGGYQDYLRKMRESWENCI